MNAPAADSHVSVYGRSATEQARRLNKHPNMIYRLLRQGLPGTLVGGVWHVRDEDLDAFFAARTAARLGTMARPVTIAKSKSHDTADAALQAAGW